MAERLITSPEHVSVVMETVAGLLDANGFDADAPVTVDAETAAAKTFVRDVDGVVYELKLAPVEINHR